MFAITLTEIIVRLGIWPYLQELDTSISLSQCGLVLSTDAVAQLIFAPIIGRIADKFGSIRIVAIICILFLTTGNLFYSLLSFIPQTTSVFNQARLTAMFCARFMSGMGAGGVSLARLHVPKYTYPEELITHTSHQSMFQVIGTITGTAVLAVLSPIGEGSSEISSNSSYHFNMYSASG